MKKEKKDKRKTQKPKSSGRQATAMAPSNLTRYWRAPHLPLISVSRQTNPIARQLTRLGLALELAVPASAVRKHATGGKPSRPSHQEGRRT